MPTIHRIRRPDSAGDIGSGGCSIGGVRDGVGIMGRAGAVRQRGCAQAGSPQVRPAGPAAGVLLRQVDAAAGAADHRFGRRRGAVPRPAASARRFALATFTSRSPSSTHEDDDDPEQDLAHGAGQKIFPGLKMPAGSSAALTVRIRSSSTALL